MLNPRLRLSQQNTPSENNQALMRDEEGCSERKARRAGCSVSRRAPIEEARYPMMVFAMP